MNSPNVTETTAASNGADSSSTKWKDKTPQQILKDVNDLLSAVWASCEYDTDAIPNHILLPYEQVKAPGGVMICRQVEGKAGLYQIENWQELLFNGVFDTLFAQADYALPEEKEPAPAKS